MPPPDRSTPYKFTHSEDWLTMLGILDNCNASDCFFWIPTSGSRHPQSKRKEMLEKELNKPATRANLMANQKTTTKTLSAIVAKNAYFAVKEVRQSEKGQLSLRCGDALPTDADMLYSYTSVVDEEMAPEVIQSQLFEMRRLVDNVAMKEAALLESNADALKEREHTERRIMEAGLKRGHSKIYSDSSSDSDGCVDDRARRVPLHSDDGGECEDIEEETARAPASPAPSRKRALKSNEAKKSRKDKDLCNPWSGTPMDAAISRFMAAAAVKMERENEEHEISR